MRIAIHNHAPLLGRRTVLACLAAALLLLAFAASSALAATEWRVDSVHGPQNFAPGGRGQYVIVGYNVGQDPSDGSTITVTDTLPPGVTATSAAGSDWDCSGTRFPTIATVTCTTSDVIDAPGADASVRGSMQPLMINVDVGTTPGTVDNSVTIEGGGGSLVSTTDPTPIDATPAGFGFVPGSVLGDAFNADGSSARLAGSHPYEMRVDFRTNLGLFEDPDDPEAGDLFYTAPDEHIKTLVTKLPAGLIGNPQALPQCHGEALNEPGTAQKGTCPSNTQVGTLDLVLSREKQISTSIDATTDLPVFNMVPPPGAVAALGFSFLSNPVWILVTVDPTDHYSVIATIKNTIETLPVRSAQLSLWGVPGDPAHDGLRVNGVSNGTEMNTPFTGAPIKPYLTMPSTCGIPGQLRLQADSWQHPGAFTPWQNGASVVMTGCDDSRFRFDPSITVQPESHVASTPTALDVDLSAPQKNDEVTDATQLYADSGNDAAIATPPLRTAVVTLPAGMSVSPSSADGLLACTPLQIGLDNENDPTCPDASKIGTVSITTPLLPDPLTGSVYFAAQNDNPFGTMLAIYMVARGPGVVVKLPGKVEPDPVTGQLTTTFDDNPPLPFSDLHVHFNGGPRAALVTPPTCGVKTSTAQFASWNLQLPAVSRSDAFTVDGNCSKGFDPTFHAGTDNPSAGRDSPLVTRFTRSDGDQELSRIDVSLPEGLLGRISRVDLCPDAAANAGTCGDGSLIGRTTVGAGPGSNPFFITDGKVYITGPYKGAPFGLSIVVHAKAGPIDLGNVVVRSQIIVDRRTAALRVVSDPLPTILQGIPLLTRAVDVTVDRPGFAFNPTNCSVMSATATLTSTAGATSTKSSRFQAADCASLPFKPSLSITVGGKHHLGRGASTPLTAVLRMPPGQANLRGVQVTLPETVNARLNVIERACTLAEFNAGHCEKARAGTAVAVTPLLRDPLKGGVYFVRNGRPLPDMMVALRGQVDVDLDSRIAIPHSKFLRTDFNTIPDVPVTKFTLQFVSGKQGPVGAAANLCKPVNRRAAMGLQFTAQSGKVVRKSQRLNIVGCPKPKARRAKGGTTRAR